MHRYLMVKPHNDSASCELVFETRLSESLRFFGFFTGGRNTAEFACNYIFEYMKHNIVKSSEIEKMLRNAYRRCQCEMMLRIDSAMFDEGASSVVGIYSDECVWLAHIGDVVCISATEIAEREICKRHTLDDLQEKARILRHCHGWYDPDTQEVWGKCHLTKSLGNVWQLRSLQLSLHNKLSDIRNLQRKSVTALLALLDDSVEMLIDFVPDIYTFSTNQLRSHMIVMSSRLHDNMSKTFLKDLCSISDCQAASKLVRTEFVSKPGAALLVFSATPNNIPSCDDHSPL